MSSCNVSNEFKGCIKRWVMIDNKQVKLRKLTSELRKEKEKVQEYILDYMSKKKMNNTNILINDGKLSYGESKTTQSLSKRYIIEKLTKYFKSHQKEDPNFYRSWKALGSILKGSWPPKTLPIHSQIGTEI